MTSRMVIVRFGFVWYSAIQFCILASRQFDARPLAAGWFVQMFCVMASNRTNDKSEPVCPSCLAPNTSDAHFCANCNAPLTAHAATDPIYRIWASGHVYAKAAGKPPSRLALLGMWLLFGNLFFLNLPALWHSFLALLSLFVSLNGGSTNYGFFTLFAFFLLVIGIEALCVAVLVRVTINYRKQRTTNRTT